MGIRLAAEAVDAQGLPVVTWEEDRNLFAPGGFGRARVTCFIRPDVNGVLQFVSVGPVRHGAHEEARPWEALVSFSVSRADQHYYSASEKALIEVVASRGKSGAGRLVATDGAHVIEASFRDDRPGVSMHLNCAEARLADVAIVHDRLSRDFVTRKTEFLHRLGLAEFRWPDSKPPFVAYQPPAPVAISPWIRHLADLATVAVIVAIAWALYWVLA